MSGRVIIVAIPKGGVGKSTLVNNLLRFYQVFHEDLRIQPFDPDLSNGTLFKVTNGKYAPYKAVVVDPSVSRRELHPVVGCVISKAADVSVLDGIGSQQIPLIHEQWFEAVHVSDVCREHGIRITMVLVFDNSDQCYEGALDLIRRYGDDDNVDFAAFHIRRAPRDTIDLPSNKRNLEIFMGEVRKYLTDMNRFRMARLPYVEQVQASLMFRLRCALIDIQNHRILGDDMEIADYNSLWFDYADAFSHLAAFLLPTNTPCLVAA